MNQSSQSLSSAYTQELPDFQPAPCQAISTWPFQDRFSASETESTPSSCPTKSTNRKNTRTHTRNKIPLKSSTFPLSCCFWWVPLPRTQPSDPEPRHPWQPPSPLSPGDGWTLARWGGLLTWVWICSFDPVGSASGHSSSLHVQVPAVTYGLCISTLSLPPALSQGCCRRVSQLYIWPCHLLV